MLKAYLHPKKKPNDRHWYSATVRALSMAWPISSSSFILDTGIYHLSAPSLARLPR